MSVILYKGPLQVEWLPKEASTAFSANSLVTFDGSGDLVPSVADASTFIGGVCLRKVTASDADYATDGATIPVLIPMPNNTFLMDVGAGSASRLNIGIAYDITDALTVDLGATDHPVVTVVGVISSSLVEVKINSAYEFRNAA